MNKSDRVTRSAARNLQQGIANPGVRPGMRGRIIAGLPARGRTAATKTAKAPQAPLGAALDEDHQNRIEVPPPSNGRLISLPGRHPLLPVVYEVDDHPLVQKPHGKVYIGILDLSRKAMGKLFVVAANMDLPNNRRQLNSRGFVILRPRNNDYFLLRDRFGSGKPEDDRVVSWARSKKDLDDDEITEYEAIRSDILGPPELMTSTKAVKTADGYEGGIQFERHERAVNIRTGPRCYQLGATVQAQKVMSSPGLQGKVCAVVKDKDAEMRFNIVKIGARAAVKGIRKGPPGLYENLRRQAEVTALPPVGVDENIAWVAMQLNAAIAAAKASGEKLKGSLGVFGTPHLDAGDNAVAPTGMTNLSKPHPDVEEEFFNVLDFGFAWEMEEFATTFFCGLHFHGGNSACYKKIMGDRDEIYYRLTLIAYPPTQILNAKDSVALAALPDGTPFRVGIEMRNPSSHQLSKQGHCTQATWAADGGSLLTPKAHINHFSRLLTEAIVYFAQQLPPGMLPRVDKSLAMKLVSVVVDNKRITADDWDLGPGWTGEDVEIGKDYTDILAGLGVQYPQELPPRNLALLCNSDSMTQVPFNNAALQEAAADWSRRLSKAKESIPVCVVADGLEDEAIMGGRIVIQARKAAVKIARSEKNVNSKKRVNPTGNGPRTRKKAKLQTDSRVEAELSRRPSEFDDDDEIEMQGIEDLLRDSLFGSEVAVKAPKGLGLKTATRMETRQSVKKPAYDCKLLASLSSDRLTKTLKVVQTIAAGVEANLTTDMDLSKIHQIIEQGDITDSRELWSIFRNFSVERCTSNVGIWIRQKYLLLINMTIWEWLENRLDESYEQERHDPANELGSVFRRVETILETQPSQIHLDASDFLSTFRPGEAIYEQKQVRKRYVTVDKTSTLALASAILQKWLDFPDAHKYQCQAWLVRELTEHVGPQVLLLNDVWNAAHNINTHVFGAHKNSRISKTDIQQWSTKYLSAHVLAKRTSPDYKILCSIDAEIQAISSMSGSDSTFRVLQGLEPPLSNATMQGGYRSLGGSNPTEIAQGSGPSIESEDEEMESSIETELPPQVDTSNEIPDGPAFDKFYREIELLYCFLDNPSLNVTVPNKKTADAASYWTAVYRHHVELNSDKKLPFRDHAISRRRILEAGGPYSSENLSTRHGVFSAIIHRGITHNTEFLQEQKTVFHDLDDWFALCDSLEDRNEEYFCNKSAYGRGRWRSVTNAAEYWNATETPEFVKFIENEEPTDFYHLFKLFLTLPAFGKLTAYLLAVDYAIAGKATIPTLTTMGDIIGQINAGGLGGLQKLGWQELAPRDKPEISYAFETVYQELKARMPAHRKLQINFEKFGVFFVEHALCKLDRLDLSAFNKITK
ncbi:hypothetical protein GALMADRAFT_136421 [Galerina marginata CBS 339.88]|uniref:Uncharacterized protein n=1 Tax=Galerina marginata (strain CBS 339.88) TaxID=685588 RepID=A0A067T9M1_GALM3|nr:hypothetical protein GALMADRAFT_136421 [Galerina marginata CBS 339.88]